VTREGGHIFVAMLVISTVVALVEYLTWQPIWLGVSTLVFAIVTPMPLVLIVTLKLGLRKKELTIESLRKRADSLKKSVDQR